MLVCDSQQKNQSVLFKAKVTERSNIHVCLMWPILLLFACAAKSFLQEAHKMVREANVKQATAEKQLKEAQGKVVSYFNYWCLCNCKSILGISSLDYSPVLYPLRLMCYRQKWVHWRPLCWPPRRPPLTASSTPSYCLRGPEDTLATRVPLSVCLSCSQSQPVTTHTHTGKKKRYMHDWFECISVWCHSAGFRQVPDRPAFTSISFSSVLFS